MSGRDPLRDPEPLIRRVYAYVAYGIGAGPDADDVVSETFERAVRYRESYDPKLGEPVAWLLGIARRTLQATAEQRARRTHEDPPDVAGPGDLEDDSIRRLTLQAAMARLSEREREILALRYGADLSMRAIAQLLDVRTNTVEVALHRALGRLRSRLGADEALPAHPLVEGARKTL